MELEGREVQCIGCVADIIAALQLASTPTSAPAVFTHIALKRLAYIFSVVVQKIRCTLISSGFEALRVFVEAVPFPEYG